MKILDLFSGIGGFSLGFERAGFETAAFCEIDPFCQKVLARHWPGIPVYGDIIELDGTREEFSEIEIITGGFPCTDLSIAGKQQGINDNTRSGLWWEMRRLIDEIRPRFAIMENVPNFLSGGGGAWFGDFLRSLAEIGYNAEWSCISAAQFGFPHKRERVWIIAHPDERRCSLGAFEKIFLQKNMDQKKKDPCRNYSSNIIIDNFRRSYPTIPEHLRVDDGLPVELDEIKPRIKTLGNSIVPEIAYLIAEKLKTIF